MFTVAVTGGSFDFSFLSQALGSTRWFFQRGHCKGTRPWTGRAPVETGYMSFVESVAETDTWMMLMDDVWMLDEFGQVVSESGLI